MYVVTTKRSLNARIRAHEADIRKGKKSQYIKELEHVADFFNLKRTRWRTNMGKIYAVQTCVQSSEDTRVN